MTSILKSTLLLGIMTLMFTGVSAQEDKSKRKSPPMESVATVDDVTVTIKYSAPFVKGRTIFGDLEEWGEVWRTGANEATTLEVSKDVLIEGKPLPAGKYALFTIPNESQWTIILNKVHDQWGDYDYDEAKDALRAEVIPTTTDGVVEQLNISVEEMNGKSYVTISWDHTKVAFEIATS